MTALHVRELLEASRQEDSLHLVYCAQITLVNQIPTDAAA